MMGAAHPVINQLHTLGAGSPITIGTGGGTETAKPCVYSGAAAVLYLPEHHVVRA
jgi:hypothetical protein